MGDQRRDPGRTELYKMSRKIKEILFGDPRWKLSHKTMVELFDIISRHPDAPNPHKIPYGQAIDAAYNARNLIHDVGVMGSYLQLQSKQAITCSLMKLDEHYNLRNKKFINKLLPHANDDNKTKWINQCVSYLSEYKKGNTRVFVNKYEGLIRES